MPIDIHTGAVPGRIVWGNPTKARNKTRRNPVTGAEETVIGKDGQPVQQWSFGVAFPKDHFQSVIYPALYQEAIAAFPNGVPPRFAWKFKDGDGIDDKGQPFSNREGYAGHFVLTISTEAFAPPIYKLNGGSYQQISPDQIKCGDYIAMGLGIKFNGATGSNTPGLYVNPLAIEHVAFGTEIITTAGVDPNAIFGGKQYQLPAGATTQPMVTQTGATPPGMPGMPTAAPAPMAQPAVMPAAAPAQTGQQPMPGMTQPAAMPAPAHDFVQNAGQQPMVQPGMPGQMPGFPMPNQ